MAHRWAYAYLFLVLASLPCRGLAAKEEARANPLRKVITLLQNMAKETEDEGVKSKELFDKFMCYCTTNEKELTDSIGEAGSHLTELAAGIEEQSGSNAQIEQELKDLNEDVAEATKAVEEATAQRGKEAKDYAAEATETTNNIGALDKAIPALKAGLESPAEALTQLSSVVLRAPSEQASMLQGMMQGRDGAGAGGSDQIVGILEQMRDDMKANIADATQKEQEALATFEELTGAKKKELAAKGNEITEKTGRLAIQKQAVADFERDKEETEKAMAADQEFKISLTKTCKEKTAENDAAEKERNDELTAISETLKILNDDDTLELMKKSLPSPSFTQNYGSVSFVQMSMRTRSTSRSRWALRSVADTLAATGGPHAARLNLLAFGMRAEARRRQAPDLSPLKGAVNGMISDLMSEQTDDDTQLAECKEQLAFAEQEKAGLENTLSTEKSKIEELSTEKSAIEGTMKTVKAEIAELDTAMADATTQRKKEKADFDAVMSELTMTSSLLVKAKEVMEKAFAPKAEAASFVQEGGGGTWENSLNSFLGMGQAPPTASYEKKTGAGMGVIGLLDNLLGDIKLQQQQEEMNEAAAQKDYEEIAAKTKESRGSKMQDNISNEDMLTALAEQLLEVKKENDQTKTEHLSVEEKLQALHASCDFLLKNHGERQKARSEEVESLKNSLAVLSGAVLEPPAAAFLQVSASRRLRRSGA